MKKGALPNKSKLNLQTNSNDTFSLMEGQKPLAERMRPESLNDYFGQQHLVGKSGLLYSILKSGNIPSMILWGPPGVGKTTLANILSHELDRPFHALSAINSGVKDVREVIQRAERQHLFSQPHPILFIDEIHRFSKSQQDALLGAVEKGVITLIGATTENPSFEVIPALLSRMQVYVLEQLDKEDLIGLANHALANDQVLSKKKIEIAEYEALLKYSTGDGRRLLNCLELVINKSYEHEKLVIDNDLVENTVQQNMVLYDKTGEQHYNVISAFIKSVRGSDPNAAVYYLAKMVEAGEDPLFICRRMIILASEDVGLANPNALLMANQCFQAVHRIGYPEARIIMSQAAIYLACSPKSNSAYKAIGKAQEELRKRPNEPVPLSLRNAPTKLMKSLYYGKDYQYAHDFDGNMVDENYLPEYLEGHAFYTPSDNPNENKLTQKIKEFWKKRYGY